MRDFILITLVPVMIVPLVAAYQIYKAQHNRYTWLAIIGMLLIGYAMYSGSTAITTIVAENSSKQEGGYTDQTLIEDTVADTVTGRRFLGLSAVVLGVAFQIPWYRKFREYAHDKLIPLDQVNIAITYFSLTTLACALFWTG